MPDQPDQPANYPPPGNPAPWRQMPSPIMLAVAVVLLLGFGAWGANRLFGSSGVAVITAVREIAHLETVDFYIQDVIEKNEPQTVFGHVIANDHILLLVPAHVTAGVDLGALRDADVEVNAAQHRVRLHLPAPVIFTVAIDTAHVRAWRTTDLLARAHQDLETSALRDAETQLRQAALTGGILTNAKTSAERVVRSVMRSLGFNTVEVVWAT